MAVKIPEKTKKWFIKQLCGDIESKIPEKPSVNIPKIRSVRIDYRLTNNLLFDSGSGRKRRKDSKKDEKD
ncbi:MAG: hypothetical protein K6F49_01405 [Saccharofermentans sp.]|nr:hypothetical protein [Saccharofermentans sp.]